MKEGLTEIVFILDRSGSMFGLEADTIGGYNAFIEKQKKVDGEAIVSTVLFSGHIKVIHNRVPIEKIEPMTENQYQVGGNTALLDAIGYSVHHIKKLHKNLNENERPEKTVFVITTDGQENSSKVCTYPIVKKMIEKQTEKHGWEFLFLGANIDAITEASKLGICPSRAVRYECDKAGTAVNFSTLSEEISNYRLKGAIRESWKAEIEKYCLGKGNDK